MRAMFLVGAIVGGTLAGFTAPPKGQQVSVGDVLLRVGQYLVQYETGLATVLAEEQYSQWIEVLLTVVARRTLTSDFLFIRIKDPVRGAAWLGFRDVIKDGAPVRNRNDRLTATLRAGRPDTLAQLDRIGDENARHNLGDVYRTLNVPVPTLALEFLHPQYRARSTFRRTGEDTIDGIHTWKIAYTEHTRPTLIHGGQGRDRAARGTAWVDPRDGSVLRTELEVGGDDPIEQFRSRITVEYQWDRGLNLRVPTEMQEVYDQPTQRIRGAATYRNFRRFETSARIVPPQG